MRHRVRRRSASAAALVSTALICGLVQGQAWADPAQPAAAAAEDPSPIAPADREKVLGKGWKASDDRAWTTSGDAAGFHVLVADQKAGYGWRTAATLAEPGFDADMWIGNACVTGSGKRAVVAYAPRTFTNRPELMARGAFTAVVDLTSGAVTKLDRQASLAYFSPGCGTGETAVLTQAGGDTKNQTRLLTVDVSEGRVSRTTEVAGQVTSAIPVGKDIVAADSARLTRIDDQGRRTTLARTGQVPFGLKADAEGGLVYLDRPAGSDDKGEVKRISAADITRGNSDKTKQSVLARGTLTKMDVSSSAGGTVFITGDTQAADPLPKTVQRRPDVPKDSQVTTGAKALVTKVAAIGESDPRKPQDLSAKTARISLKVLATGKDTDFTVTPSVPAAQAAAGTAPSPALTAAGTGPSPGPAAPKSAPALSSFALAAPRAASLAEDERYCAVGRNDPAKQAMQPKPRQVEWAVDQVVNGTLDKNVSRPANWKNLGMSAYQPQTLFPRLGLNSGGRVPAQVLLGVSAQESNMWQASRVVVPGVTGNPLIGNYYGIKYAANGQQTDPWGINWAEADCGYGITQITDGMRMHGREKTGEVATLSKLQQEAAALDYTANVAAGQRVLADKWNITNQDGLVVNNGDPKYIENWFFALWAYNSGYYPKAAAASNGGLWGVGFTNNPANPLWKANRTPFLEGPAGANDYSHAKHPQDWPYQEKVLGWAARPLEALESPGKMVAGFREAWWTSPALRSTVKPAESLFCTVANNCDPSKIGPNDKNEPGLGACNRTDLKCWWNQPVTWKDCGTKAECGNELIRFNDTYKEEADGTAYPPNCTTQGLPANALVIDDVPDGTPIARPGCSLPKATSGTFSLDFATPSARIDFQQLGAGYGGHFWFAHTRKSGPEGDRMKVTGTWKLNQALDKDAKVWVHLPDHGAHTKVANYEINTANGWQQKVVSQPGTGNRWVSLGAYRFKGFVPEVRLTSITSDGTGDQDIAFDAVAFEPGNFSQIPELRIPEADPNASDEPYDKAPYEPMHVGSATPMSSMLLKQAPGTSGPLSVSAVEALQGSTCEAIARKPGEQLCHSKKTVAGPGLSAPAQPQMLAASPPIYSTDADALCNSVGAKPIVLTRDAACMREMHAWTRLKDNAPVGRAIFLVDAPTQLDIRSPEFEQRIKITPQQIDPGFGPVSMTARANCNGPCQTSTMQWTVPADWAPGDAHTAVASVKHRWTNTNGKDMLSHSWGLSISMFGKKTEVDRSDAMLRVRCDDITKGTKAYNKTGCVFPAYAPTYLVNSARYPSAAALYWVLQEKLPNHVGSKAHNSPVRYLGPGNMKGKDKNGNPKDRLNTENRSVICPTGWALHGYTCDEYSFAVTHESGGMPGGPNEVGSGDSCANLDAEKLSTGEWKLVDDTRYPIPTWTEKCGRASIPGPDNSGAANLIGRQFVPDKRMLDEDAFFVGIPGFEGCDPNTICTLRPRP
ncbi:golvesin C-terminal-like domain-containing protein [Streptomyces nojiriensis]|uniref:golvesin C-terminal-like domain-containing protein n=1 Tax=Streptomyces nojiriensis TaxID=66374 RepID=UPI0035D662B8